MLHRMIRWKCAGGSPNAARCSNVTIKGLLHLLASMRQGLQVYAGMICLPRHHVSGRCMTFNHEQSNVHNACQDLD